MFELKENNMNCKETEFTVSKGLNKLLAVLLFTLGVMMIVNVILKNITTISLITKKQKNITMNTEVSEKI